MEMRLHPDTLCHNYYPRNHHGISTVLSPVKIDEFKVIILDTFEFDFYRYLPSNILPIDNETE
jgi:hypothetical protein